MCLQHLLCKQCLEQEEGQGDRAREVLCMVWLLEGSGKLAVTRSDQQEGIQPKASWS